LNIFGTASQRLNRLLTLFFYRKLLADTMIGGDMELLLKRCMTLHHPFTSQKLREALGEKLLRL